MSSGKGPSKQEVVDAIISRSPDRLQHLIDQGYDLTLPLFGDTIDIFDHTSKKFELSADDILAVSSKEGYSDVFFPLHVAVVALYHEATKVVSSDYGLSKATETIGILLARGARWYSGCGPLFILNVRNYNWVCFSADFPENGPIQLAMFLKRYEEWGSNKHMDNAIKLLQNASKSKQPTSLNTEPVLKSVANCYKNMLFSSDFSDVTFNCSDGVCVPAHKVILASASPYFKAAFQGSNRWSENNAEGVWKTSHNSNLIKSVLTLIYTGSVDECKKLVNGKDTDPLSLMELACEYEIQPLILICVDNCKKGLSVHNVRRALGLSQVHSCELKKVCFEFVKKNSTKVLMHPDVIKMASEDPKLWEELGSFLNGTSVSAEKPSKRARTENEE